MKHAQTTRIILAGGEGRRMGQDKAGLVWQGMTLLERAARRASEGHDGAVAVVGRARPPDWPLPAVRFVPDDDAHQGPLLGLLTALRAFPGQHLLVLACDLPLLDTRALDWLMDEADAQTPLADGLVCVNNAQWEPLFAIYAPSCLPLVEDCRREGIGSLRAMIRRGQFAFADAPSWMCAGLTNINTPGDLDALPQSPAMP